MYARKAEKSVNFQKIKLLVRDYEFLKKKFDFVVSQFHGFILSEFQGVEDHYFAVSQFHGFTKSTFFCILQVLSYYSILFSMGHMWGWFLLLMVFESKPRV